MTKAPEKAEVKPKNTEEVKKETREKLDKAKADSVTGLFQKLLADFKDLDSKERMKRIGQIVFVATLGKFMPKKMTEMVGKKEAEKKESGKKAKEADEEKEKEPKSIGDKIAKIASGFIDKIREEFRTPDVAGGNLACAKVATTILQEAGANDKVILSVGATKRYLMKNGWKKAKKPPKPGDVIIWAPTKGYTKDENGVSVANGHRHIGVALDAERCVSNSSSKKMPKEHNIFTRRPVEDILRPPDSMAA